MSQAEREPSRVGKRRRIWKTPRSSASWLGLVYVLLFSGSIFGVYLFALHAQLEPQPLNEPLRTFGIIAFIMVLGTAAYSLRRRFMHSLPGKVQGWLWLHTWMGIAALFIALFHESFTFVLHDYCWRADCFTNTYWAESALFGLIFLVISGVIGRLLDRWQVAIIAHEASINGVGIMQAVEERLIELEYTIERLCAGKSPPFKEHFIHALEKRREPPRFLPGIAQNEHTDFQRAQDTIVSYAKLMKSLHRQRHARFVIRAWRSIHIVLASLALLVITFHGVMELLTNVFHIIQPQ